MPPFDRWLRSRPGWVLANLFYDKVEDLPEVSDLAGWRILIGVQNYRVNARLTEKVLDLMPSYDPKGKEVPQRFETWASFVMPALAEERKQQDQVLREHLQSLGNIKALKVTPIAVPSHRGIDYAKRLSQRISSEE